MQSARAALATCQKLYTLQKITVKFKVLLLNYHSTKFLSVIIHEILIQENDHLKN